MFTDPRLEPQPKPWVIPQQEEEPRFFINKPIQKSTEEDFSTKMIPGFESKSYEKELPTSSISPYTRDLDYERAISQSTGSQLSNGVGRVLLNTIPGVIENVASMIDFEDYANQDYEVGNAITSAIEEWREQNTERFPIYRENPNKSFDVGDSAWWIENGSSLVGSMSEFVATGAGLGVFLGGISKLGKLGELASTLLSASGLNQAESMMDATNTYKSIFEKEILKGSNPSEAAEVASNAASTVVNIDRINILTNLTSANLFMKTPVGTRMKLKLPTTSKELQVGLREGLQEYSEETVNLIAQKAGEEPEYTFEDAMNVISTPEGIEAGVLGFVGGMGQTIGTHLANRLTGKTKEDRERYINQVNEIQKIESLLTEQNLPSVSSAFMDIKQVTELGTEISDAQQKGDLQRQEKALDKLLEFQAYKAFQNGTTDNLISTYDKIKNLPLEEAAQKQLVTDEKSSDYYSSRADKAIKTIEELEDIYNTLELRKYINGAELLENRSEANKVKKAIRQIETSISNIERVSDREASGTEIKQLEDLRESYDERLKRLGKEYKNMTSKEYQDEKLKSIQSKADTQRKLNLENNKAIIKEDPDKINEVLDRGDYNPEEESALKQEAESAQASTRTGRRNDNTLYDDEITEEQTPIFDDSFTEEETTEGPTFDDSIDEVEGFVDTTKEIIPELPKKDILKNQLFGINKTTKESSFTSKKAEIERNFSGKDKETLLKALDDRYFALKGLHLIPISDDQKSEIDVDKSTDEATRPTIDKNKESLEVNKGLEEDIKKKNNPNTGLLSLAYRVEEDGNIIDKFKDLLHPNKFKSGTKLTLRLADDPTIPISKTQTWGELKPTLKDKNDIIGKIPIQVIYEGNIIGYLHDYDWKPNYDVDPTILDNDKVELFNLRSSIVDQGEVETTITKKTNGVYRKGKLKTLKELPIDDNRKLHISMQKGLFPSINETLASNSPLYTERFGHTYISFIVGYENGLPIKMLYDTFDTKLSDKPELQKTISETVRQSIGIFQKISLKEILTEEEKKIISDIKNATKKGTFQGLDITTIPDLKEYLSQFIQIADVRGSDGNLRKFANQYTIEEVPNLNLLSITNQGFEVLSRVKGIQFSFFGRWGVNTKENLDYFNKATQLLNRNLRNYYTHISDFGLEANLPLVGIVDEKVTTLYNSYEEYANDVLRTDLDPIQIDENTLSYMVQNRIYLNNKVEKKEQPIQTTEPIVSEKIDESDEGLNFEYREDDDFVVGSDLSLIEENTKDLLVRELGARKQQEFVDYIVSLSIAEITKQGRTSLSSITDPIFDKIRKDSITSKRLITRFKDTPKADKYKRILSLTETILNNETTLLNISKHLLDKVSLIKTIDDETELQDGDDDRQGKDNWGKQDAETDTKSKVSRELKLFFSGIHEYDKNGNIVKNFLGQEKFMWWGDIFNDLQVMTANLQPDFNIINNELALYTISRPYLREAIDKINAAPSNIRNQFVEIMSNHANHMEYAAWSKDSNGNIKYVIQPSNVNNVQTVITNRWFNQFKASPIITNDLEGNDIFDKEKVEIFLKKYDELKKRLTIEGLDQWLNLIGIDLGKLTLKAISENKYVNSKGKIINFQSFLRNDVCYSLYQDIKGLRNAEITDEVNPFGQNMIKDLAKFEARYTPTSLSNSHRAGGKQVYSYNQNKFLTNNIIDIKALKQYGDIYTSPLLTQKLLTPYSRRSLWLHNMIEHDENGKPLMHNGEVVVNPNNEYFTNFNYWTSDLEGIKQQGRPSRDGREMSKLPDVEIERIKIARMQSSFINLSEKELKNKERIGETIYLTTSDKPTVIGLKTILPNITLNENGLPSEETYDLLFDQLVMPEVDRMIQYRKHKTNKVDFNDLNYEGGATKFLIIPELNKIDGIFDKVGDTKGFISQSVLTSEMKEQMKGVFKLHIDTLIIRKKEFWKEVGIGVDIEGKTKYKRAFLDSWFLDNVITGSDKITGAATYMVAQTLISDVNVTMLFTGDPALYFDAKKTKKMNIDAAIRNTFTNLGKRLAADVGPKTSNQDSLDSNTIVGVVDDRVLESLQYNKYLEILGKKDASKYKKITGTDAQELTTIRERLRTLEDRGKLSPDLYSNAVRIINRELEQKNYYYSRIVEKELNELREGLGDEYMEVSLTPDKPQYTYNIFDPILKIEKRIFVKSSSYPLRDDLTKGMELDKLRIAMEVQGLDRIAFKSAIKVGSPTTITNLWNEDGSIKEYPNDNLILEHANLKKSSENEERIAELESKYIFFHGGNTLVLPRRGMGIQQETPYDPLHDVINRVTQAHKNLFLDLLDTKGFKYGDQEYDGRGLQEVYLQKFNSLFKSLRQELLDELGVDDNFDLKDRTNFITKVKDVIRKEMISRSYPLTDIEFLNLDNSLDMIAYLPSGQKIEALLNSIVRNRILKMKFPGYSFILGSEEGYQSVKEFDPKESGFIFTDKFEGTLKENQVIIPFTFKDDKGQLLKIGDYIDHSTGRIDYKKLPPELLEMVAMRIPNSSQSLQAAVEVVGFIPIPADLIIATRDFIAKMGQDFDVDKMYIYKTGTKFVNGKLERVDTGKIGLMNDIIDIMKSVHKNPETWKKSLNPIGEWRLQEIADNIDQINAKRDTFFSGLSDEYQTKKFVQANAAKSAVGIYASLSIFNAISQDKNLTLVDPETQEGVEIKFGKNISNGDLSGIQTFSGINKSLVIEGVLSGALDNEKLQILDKLNMNSDTFNVVSLMLSMGFDEDIFYFITQPSIVDYINIRNRSRAIGDYKTSSDIFDEIKVKYAQLDDSLNNISVSELRENADQLGMKELEQMLFDNSNYKDFYKHQIGLLHKFMDLEEHSRAMSTPMKLLSVDSNGFGKSLIEANEFQFALNNLSKRIHNVKNLFGKFDEEDNFIEPTTIPGMSLFYGLQTNTKLWNRFFPYQSNSFQTVRDSIIKNLRGFDSIQSNADNTKLAWEEMKSYLYSKANLGLLNNESIDQFRERAFYGKNSLAKIVLRVRNTIKNDFLNALEVNIQTGKRPSTIGYKAAAKENDNELRLYVSFLDLLRKQNLGENKKPLIIDGKEYSSQDLYHDLVTAFYISGGNQKANQYGRYISPSYLYSIPFGRELMKRSTIDNLNIREPENPHYVHPAILQIYQHNADVISTKFREEDLVKYEDGFTLKESLLKTYKDNPFGEYPKNLPTIFSVFDYEASAGSNKWVPYLYIGFKSGKPIYKELNSLGTRDWNEYNANSDKVVASILAKKPITFELTTPDKISEEIESPNSSTFEQIGVKESNTKEESTEVIKDVLAGIINNPESLYRDLAQFYYENVNFNINKIVFKEGTFLTGSYNTVEKSLSFYKPEVPIKKLQDTFLHELTHSITIDGYYDPKNKEIRDIIDNLRIVLRREVEEGKYPKITTDYFLVRKYMLQQKVNESKDKKEIQEYRREIYQIDKKLGKLKDVDIIDYVKSDYERFSKIKPIMYGLENGREFVQSVIKDEEFQKFLNEIPSKNPIKKSLFHEILDHLIEIINKYIGIKKGSLLEEALESSLKLIQIYPENYKSNIDEAPFDISVDIVTIEETLKQFGEIDRDGNKKRLRVQTDGSNTNYLTMMKRAISINQGQNNYKASVIKTMVNSKEFWTISLENRNNLLTFEERYNSIPDSVVNKYIKNCR